MITDTEVTELAQTIFRAHATGEQGRVTYLRTVLIAAKESLQKGAPKDEQLNALAAIHSRFYPLVLNAAGEFVPRGTKDRGVEIQRRCNFARTALYALRQHVRAGGDLATTKDTVTRRQLMRPSARALTPASARRLTLRVGKDAAKVVESIAKLMDVDRSAAAKEIQFLMDKLAEYMLPAAPPPPTRLRRAIRTNREPAMMA